MSNEQTSMEASVRRRIALLHETLPDSIGSRLGFELITCDAEKGEYTLQCKTQAWMNNLSNILHGGIGATILDQAMGNIAQCVMPGEGTVSTVQLQVTYHRPLIPGADVQVRVRVQSVTKNLIHLSAEASLASAPQRLCITGTSMFFYKPTAAEKKL